MNRKLSAVGWGAFFIWIGIAFLTNITWGVGLLGVGVITLAGEAVRKYFGVMPGVVLADDGHHFRRWGASEVLQMQLGGILWPILSIALGLVILVTALRPHPRH